MRKLRDRRVKYMPHTKVGLGFKATSTELQSLSPCEF